MSKDNRHFKDNAYKKRIEAVFVRDKYKCQICGKMLKKSLRGKEQPDSPTIDHIQPLSRGGKNGTKNMQTACRKCNSEKGSQYRN